MQENTTTRHRFDSRYWFRAPHELRDAINAAARRSLSTPSDYTRRALLSQLKRDGVEIEFAAATEAA